MIRRWRMRRRLRRAIERSLDRAMWAGVLAVAAALIRDPDYGHYVRKLDSSDHSLSLLRRRLERSTR